MHLEFNIDEKSHTAQLSIELANLTTPKETKNLLALITIISADFYFDPELELAQLQEIIDNGSLNNNKIFIEINTKERRKRERSWL